ncbi:Nucleic acid-binding, OB-fold [Sesbania bispinosa]|nr:Nucleic acid-binding, OB-fold [Sesbania bispinosa]
MLENLSVGKYKPTMHEFRMFFKRETRVYSDRRFFHSPSMVFHLSPFVEILNETKDDRRLVDVLGVVTGKGNLIEFKKEGKPCNYVVIELENIEGGLKLRCTLWEDYAFMFLKHLEDHPSESYVVVLQFAKMKNFKASLTTEEEFLERGVYKSMLIFERSNTVGWSSSIVKNVVTHYFNFCDKGGDKNRHPEEIDSFKDKKFLFKVQVKIQDMESIVPYVISISRLCFENNIIVSFERNTKLEEVALIQDNSELLSQFTESSDLLKDNLSVSCDNGVDTPSPLLPDWKTASNMDSSVIKVLDVDLAEYCGNASFDTPSKCKG